MSIQKTKKYRVPVFLFLVFSSFLMSINAISFPFSGRTAEIDSSVFQYVTKVLLEGGMPYLDTFDHKGPILFLINGLGMLISERYGLWIMEWLTIFTTFIFAYKIARLMGCKRIASCSVVAISIFVLFDFFEGGNFVEEYACVFLTLSLYLFLQFFKTSRTSVWKLILCGASFAAVCLLRINMVVLWGGMCIGVIIHCVRIGETRRIVSFIIWFLFGIVLVCVPIIIWLCKRGAFEAFIYDYFVFNLLYSSNATWATLKDKIKTFLTFCTNKSVITALSLLIYYCFSKKKLADWLCLVVLILSLLSISISGHVFGHYGMILYPLVVFAISRVFSDIEEKLSSSSAAVKHQKLGAVLAILCATALMFYPSALSMLRHFSKFSPQPIPNANVQIAEIVREHTDEKDLISVCGNQDVIYLLSDRKSVSKYSYQVPIALVDPQIREDYLKDIAQLDAKVIVIGVSGTAHYLWNDLYKIIEPNYDKIATVEDMTIYLRKS